ncbi:Metallo-dependent hydrolase [Glarea lozoyensis ATCC 20868]|uniref:Metallo-dependent hydrolase n=1 Tax=Glarea lozoyensis (strain ATCC 20868 / MF5171) TaxID=1116229 RepID=S3DNX2_GLAL2|nr:Metallo-dependent hydrolase [Glarea lozoyensis ATCC 20868]EPE28173.1 Metallo-dependent hydrolase [Glarea lozoyensis ATCC 20868]
MTPLQPPWKLSPPKTYILQNATIICPLTSRLIPHQTLKLSHGRITSITPYEEDYDLVSHPHEITLDLTGRYISPGLIDSHVHICAVPGPPTLSDLFNLPADVGKLQEPYLLRQMLQRGFTSVRDCGGATLTLKEGVESGLIRGPRLFLAGKALSQTGGHGDTRGAHDVSTCCSSLQLARRVDGVASCLHGAREELRRGASFLKIMSGGGVASPTDKLESIQFTPEEVRAITTVAEQAGTYVTAHAYTPRTIRHAVENGVTGIEHGNLLDEATARMMSERGVFLTPTLVTYSAMGMEEFEGYVPAGSQEKNEGVLEAGLKALKIAHDAGVTMLFGTDLLGPMGMLQTKEFGLRRRVLSSSEILKHATVNPAKRLGMESELGQVREGFVADLLILNANPLDDIEFLDRPEKHLLAVIKDGRVEFSQWKELREDVVEAKLFIE